MDCKGDSLGLWRAVRLWGEEVLGKLELRGGGGNETLTMWDVHG